MFVLDSNIYSANIRNAHALFTKHSLIMPMLSFTFLVNRPMLNTMWSSILSFITWSVFCALARFVFSAL